MLRRVLVSIPVTAAIALLGFIAASLLLSPDASTGVRLLSIAPGLLSVILLSCLIMSWARPTIRIVQIAIWSSAVFVVAFLLGSLDADSISGLELVTVIFFAAALALACWCLSVLSRHMKEG